MHRKNDLKNKLQSILRKVTIAYEIILWFYVTFCFCFSNRGLAGTHKKFDILRISAVNVRKYVDFTVNFSINYSNFQVKGMFIKNPGKF